MKKVNIYTVILGAMIVAAMLLLFVQPTDGLGDWEFLGILAVTKLGGAALVFWAVRLAEKWDAQGKIILRDDDTIFE